MPVHDLGYRNWSGSISSSWSRWWVIARSGLRIAWKSNWIKRLIFVAWMPVLYWGAFFFFIERALDENWQDRFRQVQGQIANQPNEPQASNQPGGSDLQDGRESEGMETLNELADMPLFADAPSRILAAFSAESKNEARHLLWCYLLELYFRYPQGLLTLFLIGLTVPPLISKDLRSRAFLLYFSRPISRAEYIFGKLAIPAVFLMGISTLPALALYVFGVLLSPDLSVLIDTWDIPFRIFIASACLVIPTSCLSLMLSSLTQESRFATFAWFTIWGVGAASWGIIFAATFGDSYIQYESPWQLISLYNVLGNAQSWVFGQTDVAMAAPSFVILFGVTAYSLALMYRRISAPIEA